MRLESFEISNYRSIAQLKIDPCGDFNVLIGRNNSGKSNILASIEAFFSALRPEVINTSPPIGQEIDFFQRDLRNNIQLRATFAPSADEMQQLLDEIALERPQVKKLLEEIGTDALLAITTVFTPPPRKYAFVQSIVLITEDGLRTIVEIDEKVAAELHANVAGMERRASANQALNRAARQFDAEDYAIARRQRTRDQIGGPPAEYYFRRYVDDDAALTSELVRLFQASDSDEQIIREFAKTMGVNLGQLNTGFIQMNGVRNLGHYAAAEVVSFLTKRRVRLSFLVDSDESKSFHFQRLRDEFGQSARVHVLGRREIENYLLSPAANIRHLSLRKRSSKEQFAPPDQDTFQRLELEAAESLKSLAIWKRILATASRPLYPKKLSDVRPTVESQMKDAAKDMLEKVKLEVEATILGLDQLCEEASRMVEADWSKTRLDIVPGSAILDEVYKKFGARYDKMRDGIGVASQMRREEIDPEMRDFIRKLDSSHDASL